MHGGVICRGYMKTERCGMKTRVGELWAVVVSLCLWEAGCLFLLCWWEGSALAFACGGTSSSSSNFRCGVCCGSPETVPASLFVVFCCVVKCTTLCANSRTRCLRDAATGQSPCFVCVFVCFSCCSSCCSLSLVLAVLLWLLPLISSLLSLSLSCRCCRSSCLSRSVLD